MNDPESQGVFWYNITDLASSVRSVQVQRGVGTSTNGAASFGGSVNMQSDLLPDTTFATLLLGAGSYGTLRESFAFGTPLKNGFALEGRFTKTDSKGYVDRASSDLMSYNINGGYSNGKTLVKLLAFGGSEKTYMAWDGINAEKLRTYRQYNPAGAYTDPAAPFGESYYNNQTDNYQQHNFQVLLNQTLNPHLFLNVTLHGTRGKGYYEQYKEDAKLKKYFDATTQLTDKSARSNLIRQKWLDNELAGGIVALNYYNNRVQATLGGGLQYFRNHHYGNLLWLSDASKIVAGLYKDGYEYYRNTGRKTDGNIYAKSNYKLSNTLSVFGDLQYRKVRYMLEGSNDDDDYLRNLRLRDDFDFFNPKVGVAYKDKSFAFNASMAVANREPTRKNYTEGVYRDVNGELQNMPKAEQLLDYEVGGSYANHFMAAGINFYYMAYKDQLIATGEISETGSLLTANVPNSYRAGIELMLSAQLGNWLKWEGNATLSSNKIKEFVAHTEAYDAAWNDLPEDVHTYKNVTIAYSPSLIASSLLTLHFNRCDILFQTQYVGEQYIDNTARDNASLPDYSVSNLVFKYNMGSIMKGIKDIGLSLHFNNIFNREYCNNAYAYWTYKLGDEIRTDMRYFPQATFNVYAGIEIRF